MTDLQIALTLIGVASLLCLLKDWKIGNVDND